MTPRQLIPTTPLPAWFRYPRNAVLVLYAAVGLGCVVASLAMGAIGLVVYRDFTSYSLAGNPWDATSFPWYVIWPMRLMSIVGAQMIVAIGFAVLFILVALCWPDRLGSPVAKRIGIGFLALLLELGAAAWFGRWFG